MRTRVLENDRRVPLERAKRGALHWGIIKRDSKSLIIHGSNVSRRQMRFTIRLTTLMW
ncbi:MAG TPA: hypothetical protein VGM50_10760 [Gemmatimonadaceae bacterium]